MNKNIILTLCVISGFFLNAQVNLDSLYSVWQDQSQSVPIRANAYSNYIWDGFLFSQPDSAFILANELVLFGLDNNYPKAQAGGYTIQGVSWANRSDYPKMLDYYTKALVIFEQIGDPGSIALALNNIGTVYDKQGDYPKALDYYIQSLEINEQIGHQNETAVALSNIGDIYMRQGDYTKALEYNLQSLEYNKQIGYQNEMAAALSNIGVVYQKQGDYPKALDYYTQSLRVHEQIDHQIGIAIALHDIGVIYQKQGDYPKALDYFTQSLKINEQTGQQSGIARSLTDIGKIYMYQEDYPKALNYCQRGYELSLSIGSLEIQKVGCSFLYDAYKAIGDDNKALKYLELLTVIEDSLHAEETSQKLQQMEFQKVILQDSIAKAQEAYLIKKDHEKELHQEEKTRNMILGVGVFFVLLAGSFYIRWRYVRKSKASLQIEKDRSENLLLNILPAEIAEELKDKGKANARDFETVSILFTDFKGFTQLSEKLNAKELVAEINHCYEAFDAICEKHSVEKIKTIGDSYMAAGGLPVPNLESTKNTVLAALDMTAFMIARKKEREAIRQPPFEMRTGIHTGNVVAGIVGVKKFQYDIWGDSVNTASRMESNGEVGKVNISQSTYELLKNNTQFTFEHRGKISAKGKGEINMYFVSRK